MITRSVIISVRNTGVLVARALERAFARTFQDTDVIVAKNGWGDGNPERLGRCRDPIDNAKRGVDHSRLSRMSRFDCCFVGSTGFAFPHIDLSR
jgi:hypothetical protein